MFGLSQSFSYISSLPYLVDVQRLHENVIEFYVLTDLNGWAFVYQLSLSGIDSYYSNLNFRYCACLGQTDSWKQSAFSL